LLRIEKAVAIFCIVGLRSFAGLRFIRLQCGIEVLKAAAPEKALRGTPAGISLRAFLTKGFKSFFQGQSVPSGKHVLRHPITPADFSVRQGLDDLRVKALGRLCKAQLLRSPVGQIYFYFRLAKL